MCHPKVTQHTRQHNTTRPLTTCNFCVKVEIKNRRLLERSRHLNSSKKMVDVFLICVIVIAFFILSVIGLYLVVKYQHPDDKNDAYIPKLVVLLGFVLAGGTVFLLPLDVANNSNFAGERVHENVGWCYLDYLSLVFNFNVSLILIK